MMGAKQLALMLKLAAHRKCPSYAEQGRHLRDVREARLLRDAGLTIDRLRIERNELQSQMRNRL